MRFGFWLPWWLFPVYALVWVCFLPLWIVLAVIRAATRHRDERRRDVVRVTVRIQEQDEIITAGDGHGFSIRLTLGEYRKWAKLATSGDREAADAYLMEIAGRALRHEDAQEREEAPTQPGGG